MTLELDHMFICTAVDAPEADLLVAFGLTEGTPNSHPGHLLPPLLLPQRHARIGVGP